MATIDKKYYINVKEIMEKHNLSRPRPRMLSGDGEFLPLMVVDTCE